MDRRSAMLRPALWFVATLGSVGAGLAGCNAGDIGDTGASIEQIQEGLRGCRGQAASTIPTSGSYVLTTFGGAGDSQPTACGGHTRNGSWYYVASRQRYGCGARVRLTNPADGRCVVAQVDDYGPDVCVENAVGSPIIDVSPLVSQAVVGVRAAGWSDRIRVHVEEVDATTPLGPCTSTAPADPDPQPDPARPDPVDPDPVTPPPAPGALTCSSATLDRSVVEGTCVQSSDDAAWYACHQGAWTAGRSGCSATYAYCDSATLGRAVPSRSCVQARRDRRWYQCVDGSWQAGGAEGQGPLGTCSSHHSL